MPIAIDYTPAGVQAAAGFGGGFFTQLGGAMHANADQAIADRVAQEENQRRLDLMREQDTLRGARDDANFNFQREQNAVNRADDWARMRFQTKQRESDFAQQLVNQRSLIDYRGEAEIRAEEAKRNAARERGKKNAMYMRQLPQTAPMFAQPADAQYIDQLLEGGMEPVQIFGGYRNYEAARGSGLIPVGMDAAAKEHFLQGRTLDQWQLNLQRQASTQAALQRPQSSQDWLRLNQARQSQKLQIDTIDDERDMRRDELQEIRYRLRTLQKEDGYLSDKKSEAGEYNPVYKERLLLESQKKEIEGELKGLIEQKNKLWQQGTDTAVADSMLDQIDPAIVASGDEEAVFRALAEKFPDYTE